VANREDEGNIKNAFEILHSEEQLCVMCSSKTEKVNWLEDLKHSVQHSIEKDRSEQDKQLQLAQEKAMKVKTVLGDKYALMGKNRKVSISNISNLDGLRGYRTQLAKRSISFDGVASSGGIPHQALQLKIQSADERKRRSDPRPCHSSEVTGCANTLPRVGSKEQGDDPKNLEPSSEEAPCSPRSNAKKKIEAALQSRLSWIKKSDDRRNSVT